ncbi:MAG: hypothetical protein L3J82_10715, partial [Planctomycetes bacterium]|nr:hypothetical protein [Planctomycetota bacterium]
RELRPDGNLVFQWNGQEIDLSKPFRRAKYADLFAEHVGFPMTDEAKVAERAGKMKLDPKLDYWATVNKILEEDVESKLIQPTFLIDYPIAICPLTKAKPDEPEIAERFELFIAGVEFANAFSELNEPVEQLARFEDQVKKGLEVEDIEAPKEVDYDYVEALEAGMPPAGGLGVGIDRLIMLLTETETIREVVLFPQMRREHSDDTAGPRQRARLAYETLMEELESPELRGNPMVKEVHEQLKALADKTREALTHKKEEAAE